jgi:hypothetical protein
MDRKNILELVRKVKKLAERGVGGEAESAKIKLKILYEKYNLTDVDFVELQESYNRYFIIRHSSDKKLLSNLICMILEVSVFSCGESNNTIRIKLTDEQYNNIVHAYEYYQQMFDDYSKYLMQAIISRNAIGYIPKQKPSAEPPTEEQPPESINPENVDNGGDKNKKNTEPEFDMIKLMKLAVAIESNPWKKLSDDKNLIASEESATVNQTNHAKTRDNFSST